MPCAPAEQMVPGRWELRRPRCLSDGAAAGTSKHYSPGRGRDGTGSMLFWVLRCRRKPRCTRVPVSRRTGGCRCGDFSTDGSALFLPSRRILCTSPDPCVHPLQPACRRPLPDAMCPCACLFPPPGPPPTTQLAARLAPSRSICCACAPPPVGALHVPSQRPPFPYCGRCASAKPSAMVIARSMSPLLYRNNPCSAAVLTLPSNPSSLIRSMNRCLPDPSWSCSA